MKGMQIIIMQGMMIFQLLAPMLALKAIAVTPIMTWIDGRKYPLEPFEGLVVLVLPI